MRPWLLCLASVVLAPGCDDSQRVLAGAFCPDLNGFSCGGSGPLALRHRQGRGPPRGGRDCGAPDLRSRCFEGFDGDGRRWVLQPARRQERVAVLGRPGQRLEARFLHRHQVCLRDAGSEQRHRLQPAEAIAVGEVIESGVGVDARCASLGYGGGSGAAAGGLPRGSCAGRVGGHGVFESRGALRWHRVATRWVDWLLHLHFGVAHAPDAASGGGPDLPDRCGSHQPGHSRVRAEDDANGCARLFLQF